MAVDPRARIKKRIGQMERDLVKCSDYAAEVGATFEAYAQDDSDQQRIEYWQNVYALMLQIKDMVSAFRPMY